LGYWWGDKKCHYYVLEYIKWLCFGEYLLAPTENIIMEKNKINLGRM
jgi:hypothetical protein